MEQQWPLAVGVRRDLAVAVPTNSAVPAHSCGCQPVRAQATWAQNRRKCGRNAVFAVACGACCERHLRSASIGLVCRSVQLANTLVQSRGAKLLRRSANERFTSQHFERLAANCCIMRRDVGWQTCLTRRRSTGVNRPTAPFAGLGTFAQVGCHERVPRGVALGTTDDLVLSLDWRGRQIGECRCSSTFGRMRHCTQPWPACHRRREPVR